MSTDTDAGVLIGYARVSTDEQSVTRQVHELRRAGCVRVYEDTMSGTKAERPGLQAALDMLMENDTLVVVELSRLGRSLGATLRLIEELDARNVGLRVMGLGLDTKTASSRFIVAVLLAFADLERSMMVERTMSGLAEARRQGRTGGRPPALSDARRAHVRRLHAEGAGFKELAALMLVSERTIRRAVAD